MKDGVIWFCGIALLIVGFIFGANVDENSNTLDSFYKIFGIISGIGTLLTAAIAGSALHTWGKKERFVAFKELERVALVCVSSIQKLKEIYEDEYWPVRKNRHYNDHKKAKDECLQSFRIALDQYRKDVCFAASLLDEKEERSFELKYVDFDNRTHSITNKIYDAYEQLEGEERHKKIIEIENDVTQLIDDIKVILRKHRGK